MARARSKPASRASAGSVRELVSDAVSGAVTAERAAAIVERAFAAEATLAVVCPECAHEFSASVPDVKKQLETLIELSKAESRGDGDGAATVIVERPAR